jgi:DNA repair protein RecO (recombination protein O)
LESLSYAEIIIYEKKSRGLQILSDIDVIESFHTLRAEYDRLPYAMTIMEIIQQIFEDEFNDEVFFDFVIEMIRAVGKAEDPETVLWYFLLKLSSYLGFKPQLSQCASCKIEEFSSPVHWSIEDGLLFCSSCRRSSPFTEELSVSNLQLLRKLQKYPHKKISEFKADSTKNGITALLIKYLNFHTDRHIHVNALKMLL